MVIVFYNPKENKIYIASFTEPMKAIDANDANLLEHIPNDDILYVQNAHFMTKMQFEGWLMTNSEVDGDPKNLSRFTNFLAGTTKKKANISQTTISLDNKLFIHTTANGTVILPDISVPKHPEGLHLTGKWNFIPLDEVGIEVLENSVHWAIARKKGKVELVNAQYVKDNKHKSKLNKSPTDASLDKILVPVGVSAEDVAVAGGIAQATGQNPDDAISILIES